MSETLQMLQALANKQSVADWIRQVLDEIRLKVTDTGEEYTVVCHNDRIDIKPGFHPPQRRKILYGLFDPGDWYAKQFIIPLESQNIHNLTGFFTDDELDPYELYRIMAFMQPHLLQAALGMPVMRNRLLLAILNLDTEWHQCMLDVDGLETQQCTVRLGANGWEITPGYHGKPQRKKVLTAQKLLDFQRRVHQAECEDTLQGWLALNSWYRSWLASVTVNA